MKILPLLWLILIIGCSTADSTPVPASPVPPDISPNEVLATAIATLENEHSVHFEAEGSLKFTQEGITLDVPISMSGDFLPPDRMKADFSLTVLGLTVESSMITIDDKEYVKDPVSGEWHISDESSFDSPLVPFSAAFIVSDPTSLEALSIVEIEEFDGTNVRHLRGFVAPGQSDAFVGYTLVEFWVGIEDARVRKVRLKGETRLGDGDDLLGNILSKFPASIGDTQTDIIGRAITDISFTFSDFGKNVVIVAPQIRPSRSR